MCVIVVKDRGVKLPQIRLLEDCWDANPHGAGIMVHRQGAPHVQIYKGYMTWAAFKSAWASLNLRRSDRIAAHFRIATSGGKTAAQTHPFPISRERRDLKATITIAPAAMAHNGICGSGEGALSDTQVFVRDILAQIDYREPAIQVLIGAHAAKHTSRYVIFDAVSDTMQLHGTWEHEDGLAFSNTHFQYKSVYGSSWDWDWDDRPAKRRNASAAITAWDKRRIPHPSGGAYQFCSRCSHWYQGPAADHDCPPPGYYFCSACNREVKEVGHKCQSSFS